MGDEEREGGFDPFAFQKPDCSYQLVLEHEEKASCTRSATDRFWELRALIVSSMEFIEDDQLRAGIEEAIGDPQNNLSINIIRLYKAEIAAGTPYGVVWECEYSKLEPRMEILWAKCKRALIGQGFLVWTISDSEKQLEGMMLDNLMTRMGQTREELPPPREMPLPGRNAPPQLMASPSPPDMNHGPAMAVLDEQRLEAERVVMAPELSARQRSHRTLRPVKSYDEHELPEDFRVPVDVEEVMVDWPSDKGVDFNTYHATDRELEEAGCAMRRALRRKMGEKRATGST